MNVHGSEQGLPQAQLRAGTTDIQHRLENLAHDPRQLRLVNRRRVDGCDLSPPRHATPCQNRAWGPSTLPAPGFAWLNGGLSQYRVHTQPTRRSLGGLCETVKVDEQGPRLGLKRPFLLT